MTEKKQPQYEIVPCNNIEDIKVGKKMIVGPDMLFGAFLLDSIAKQGLHGEIFNKEMPYVQVDDDDKETQSMKPIDVFSTRIDMDIPVSDLKRYRLAFIEEKLDEPNTEITAEERKERLQVNIPSNEEDEEESLEEMEETSPNVYTDISDKE